MANIRNGLVPAAHVPPGYIAKTQYSSMLSHAVMPAGKVDYTVTKGGLRLWAVIFVFLLLVGGLVSIVSQGQLSELADALDADRDGDHDSVDDDRDHIHEDSHQKRDLRETILLKKQEKIGPKSARASTGKLGGVRTKKDQEKAADESAEDDKEESIQVDESESVDDDESLGTNKQDQNIGEREEIKPKKKRSGKTQQLEETVSKEVAEKKATKKKAKAKKEEHEEEAAIPEPEAEPQTESEPEQDTFVKSKEKQTQSLKEEDLLQKIPVKPAQPEPKSSPQMDTKLAAAQDIKVTKKKGQPMPVLPEFTTKEAIAENDDEEPEQEIVKSKPQKQKQLKAQQQVDQNQVIQEKLQKQKEEERKLRDEQIRHSKQEYEKKQQQQQYQQQPMGKMEKEKKAEQEKQTKKPQPAKTLELESPSSTPEAATKTSPGKTSARPSKPKVTTTEEDNTVKCPKELPPEKKSSTSKKDVSKIQPKSDLRPTGQPYSRSLASPSSESAPAQQVRTLDLRMPSRRRLPHEAVESVSKDLHQPKLSKKQQSSKTVEDVHHRQEKHGKSQIVDTVSEAEHLQRQRVTYRKSEITNNDDFELRDELDDADLLLVESKYDESQAAFEVLVKKYPNSPRAQFGLAKTLDLVSERRQSNILLEQAIAEYEKIFLMDSVPDSLLLQITNRVVDRCRFRGWLAKSAQLQRRMVDKFPDRIDLLNDLAVTFLMMGRYDDSKNIFEDVLHKDPRNGVAQAYYGFILKAVDNNLEGAVKYLEGGIAAGQEEGRFFYHLGDALQRLGQDKKALQVYEKAAKKGFFPSAQQRSLFNIAGLRAQPFWEPEETHYEKFLNMLEKEWRSIREEAIAALDRFEWRFTVDDPKLIETGNWSHFVLAHRGKRDDTKCIRMPKTCALIQRIPAAINCRHGVIRISLLRHGTKLRPHCGPTNTRIRAHLALAPAGSSPATVLQVGQEEPRTWKQGKVLIFDDSFEHRLLNEAKTSLLLLSIDFWHPDLSLQQRAALAPV